MVATFVTAFIKIYDNPDIYRSLSTRVKHFDTLAESGLNIVVYVSEEYSSLIKAYPNVRVIIYDIYKSTTYTALKDKRDKLPEHRNTVKDTFEFLLLMNAKVEFLHQTACVNPFNTKNFAWIDFNIFHVVKNTSIAYINLRNAATAIPNGKILIPGCWEKSSGDLNVINWRFCGGFFLTDLAGACSFWTSVSKAYTTLPIITWEVNVWGLLPDSLFKWFKADHNDTIITFPRDWVRPAIRIVSTEGKVSHINAPEMPGYNRTSCSYLEYNGEKYLCVRYVNYALTAEGYYIINHPKRHLCTQNVLCKLNEEWKIITGALIPKFDLQSYCEDIQGIEDLRLYVNTEGHLAFIATQREYSVCKRNRMLVGTIIDNKVVNPMVVQPPTDTNCEKNWLPIKLPDTTRDYYIYNWGPYQVGYIKDSKLVLTIDTPMPEYFSRIRGSTACITHPVTGEQWTLAHFSDDGMPRNYYHLFIKFTHDGHVQTWSEPFVFVKVGIEYCIGMTFDDADGTRVRCWISQHDRDPLCIVFEAPAFK